MRALKTGEDGGKEGRGTEVFTPTEGDFLLAGRGITGTEWHYRQRVTLQAESDITGRE